MFRDVRYCVVLIILFLFRNFYSFEKSLFVKLCRVILCFFLWFKVVWIVLLECYFYSVLYVCLFFVFLYRKDWGGRLVLFLLCFRIRVTCFDRI